MGRLVIERLVLINFKSYAGKQEIGPFNANFTAVVGPNGSGKSNVIDSLLFVFGFRAKKMRHDKLANLIHKSETYPDLDFARVEVHFKYEQDGDAGDQLPDEEVNPLIVSRDVKRDSSSYYQVNGRNATYTEVTQLLKRSGIDLDHKRFLILQGEVESIALMKPKAEGDADDGLLEYLEDIIGTSVYKKQLEALEGQVEERRVDAAEKEQRAGVISKDVNRLDSERADIEASMIAHNRAAHANSRLWQYSLAAAMLELKLRREEQQRLQEQNATIAQETGTRNATVNELEKELKSLAETVANLRQQHTTAQKRAQTAKLAAVKAQKRREQAEQRRNKLERDLKDKSTERDREQSWVDKHGADALEEADQKVAQLKAELTVAQQGLDEVQQRLASKTKGLSEQVEQLQLQAEPFRTRVRNAESQKRQAQLDVDRVTQDFQAAQSREQECTVNARDIADKGIEAKKQLKQLEKDQKQIESTIDELTSKLTAAQADLDAAEKEISLHRPAVQAAREQRSSAQSRDRKEAQLLQLREKHNIRGLYGRLGSLGSIDAKYDIAVSTAGPELNNYVVDTVQTAQRCVQLLRQERIGTAKFMVLDKLRPPKAHGKWPAPRLYDLVNLSDPRFASAFYAALGDCLVVPTIEEARKVAFASGSGRNKVATLDGILVNPSGSMVGGGNPPRGLLSKVAVTVSPVALDALEQKLTAAQLAAQEAYSHIEELNTQQQELAENKPQIEVAISKAKLSLSDLETQMREIKARRATLKEECLNLSNQVEASKSSMTRIVEAADAEISAAEKDVAPIDSQIGDLQNQIMEVGGLELRMHMSKVKDLGDLKVESERHRDNLRQDQALKTGRVNQLSGEIAQLEKELHKLEAQDSSRGDASTGGPSPEDLEVQEAESSARELSGEIIKVDAKIDDSKTAINVVKAEIDSFRGQDVELRSSLDSIKVSVEESQHKTEKLQASLQELHLFDLSVARSLAREPRSAASPAPTAVESGQPQPLKVESGDVDRHDLEIEDAEVEESDEEPGYASVPTELTELTPDELEDLNEEQLIAEAKESEKLLANTKSRFDAGVLEQYRKRFAEWKERQEIADGAIAAYERVKQESISLKQRRLDEFLAGFNAISSKLKEMYSLLTMGGNAELELVDSLDPFAEGILFSVMPPRKSWRNIADLSGGEKTLSSLALVFALHHYKPTPLYVMDEIDAALDFRNVSIIANYIRDRTKNGQFVVISLRNNMFELASRLVGIYKTSNKSSSVTYNIPTSA